MKNTLATCTISPVSKTCNYTKNEMAAKFPGSEEIVVIATLNSLQEFNNFDEEGHVERYKCDFRLIYVTSNYLYDMGIPAIED